MTTDPVTDLPTWSRFAAEAAERKRIREAVDAVDLAVTELWCQCEHPAHSDVNPDDLIPPHSYGAMILAPDRAVQVRVPGLWVGIVCGRCVDAGHVTSC